MLIKNAIGYEIKGDYRIYRVNKIMMLKEIPVRI